EAARPHPETAGRIATAVDRRLDLGPAARPTLFPLVTGLLRDGPEPLRAALATVLAASDSRTSGGRTFNSGASGTPRAELLDFLLAREQEPSVLVAVLHAAASETGPADDVRALVHRTGLVLSRTPEGATRFDRALVDLGRHVPGFATRMTRWLADTPDEWAAVVGPGTRRTLENLGGARVPA
ncbi:hypothetical protein GTW63_24945, partial [Streptomyces sp. SID6137]|nr:hypothetical protein [Streptomyces sp. SID6137]